jgi:hypothetical protein
VSEQHVAPTELLARFILSSGWFRPSDKTVKGDAFMPPQNLRLSVTRHLGLQEADLWDIGKSVASQRQPPANLHGRADIAAADVIAQSLTVEPTPTPRNHANILGWPTEKPGQKIIALKLASAARFVPSDQ